MVVAECDLEAQLSTFFKLWYLACARNWLQYILIIRLLAVRFGDLRIHVIRNLIKITDNSSKDPLTIEKNLSINSSGLASASKLVSVFKYTESDSSVAS
jgi:hypothetical protein